MPGRYGDVLGNNAALTALLCSDRHCGISAEDEDSEEMCSGQDSDATLESTTLHIFSSEQRCPSPTELYIPESQDRASCGLSIERAVPKGPQPVCSELRVPSPADQRGWEPDEERCFSPGALVELRVTLSEQTSSEAGRASPGSALGTLGEPFNREAANVVHKTSTGVLQSGALRQPLRQLGVVVGSPEGSPEHLPGSEGRGIRRVGGPGSAGYQSEREGGGGGEEGGGGGGGCEGDPRSFSLSFGIPSDEVTPTEEQDSDSEGDPDQPHKHHARHSSKCQVARRGIVVRVRLCGCRSRGSLL